MSIYLDYNATAPLLPKVLERMQSIGNVPYNASSLHVFGRQARALLDNARAQVIAGLDLGSTSSLYRLIFTASCTEANNQVIKQFAASGYTLLVSSIEHISVLAPKEAAVGNSPALLPVNSEGVIDKERLEQLLKEAKSPVLVSLMAANNETGVLQPLSEIIDLVKQYKGIFHTDATQAIGRVKSLWGEQIPDIVTFSAHKIGGPMGAAAILYRKDLPLTAQLQGGGQEYRMRPGTENIPAIIGFGTAMTLQQERLQYQAQIENLRDKVESVLLGSGKAEILGKKAERLPNTSMIVMDNVLSETQLIWFDMHGIAVSAGSACSSGRIAASHVLKAMGVPESKAKCAVRVSIGEATTQEEMEAFTKIWLQLAERKGEGL